MARSPFFSQLKQMLHHHQRDQALSAKLDPIYARRRELLRLSAIASAATLAGCNAATPTLSAERSSYNPSSELEVIVVGAGLAGVHCSYRLKESGVNVALYEASKRTGGRTFSTEKGYFEGDQVAELGGELIDTDHVVMQHFAKEFDLQLDNLPNSLPKNIAYGYQYNIGGKFLTQKQIIEAFKPIDQAIRKINLELAELENNGSDCDVNTRRKEIDSQTTLIQFLQNNGASDTLMKVLHFAFVGEFGLEMEQLSVFNLLDLYPCGRNGACVSYIEGKGDKQEFKPFGDSDEIMRFHDGNEGPAREMTKRLGESIHTEHELVALARKDDHYIASFKTAHGNTLKVKAPHIVLALPFSTLRKVKIAAGTLRQSNIDIINTITYGTNAKLMGQFKSRKPWRSKGHDGSLVIDQKTTLERDIHNLWDTSRGQEGTQGLWTNFVGGNAGFSVGEGTAEEQWHSLLTPLDAVYPGVKEGYLGNSARMLWPIHKWSLGSYMAIKAGDVDLAANMPYEDNDGSLQFCGEHTSEAFQGFMEGAAETGARAASAILARLNAPQSENLGKIQQLRVAQALRKPQLRRTLLEFAKQKSLPMLS
ncbi:flavin monoamine oxidase family protein [Marinagarivorans cellulosilyticus]|uniref:Monoamine oxidase n=1 Tax=Marinagarivorans cellulosilyticus TaxID=2721545 RepID=A0AAN2BJT2_9GAMM|nr:NAD(P)/FAD-dependent oxidoreductase [Marinagarivorans cellulosilyticus]BCD97264.1 monoamine oxidase [Marinagarivorans cellulosilyticus]